MRLACGFIIIGLAACSDPEPMLITASMIDDDGIPSALTSTAGDPVEGEEVFANRDRGHCVLCHVVSTLGTEFQGNVGPALSDIGDRLTPAQLRLRIADYQIIRPGTLMPSYYRNHDLYQVGAEFTDDTVLTAQELEDLVAYLGTLKANDD